MKRVGVISIAALLLAVLAVPAWIWANGGEPGGWSGFRGGWGCPGYDDDVTLSAEQREQLAELGRKLDADTRQTRTELRTRSRELGALLREANPDPAAIQSVRQQLSALRGRLDERRLAHDLEARKIAPELGAGYDYGNIGHGRGFSGPLAGGGFGMDWGPGGCLI